MILSILSNLGIKNLPVQYAKKIISIIITLDDIIWRLRLSAFLIIFGKKNKISKSLLELRENGVSIIKNFYSLGEVNDIKNQCIKKLDELPVEKLNVEHHIHNLKINNYLFVEKFKGQIKLKGLQHVNNFFLKISKNLKSRLIAFIYQVSLGRPMLIYNVVHDGSFKHPAFPEASEDSTIAGKPHIDWSFHKLRLCLVLEDIKEESGPTVCYKKSFQSNLLSENYENMLLENLGFKVDKKFGHYINKEKLNLIENNRFPMLANKGDLILIDLKTAHHQTPLKKGERHLIWYYY